MKWYKSQSRDSSLCRKQFLLFQEGVDHFGYDYQRGRGTLTKLGGNIPADDGIPVGVRGVDHLGRGD